MRSSHVMLCHYVLRIIPIFVAIGIFDPSLALAQDVPRARGLRVFYTGHSFHMFVPERMDRLAQSAGIVDHKRVGTQGIGGSRVIQHWELADEKNQAKRALESGEVDVFTMAVHLAIPDEGVDRFTELGLKHNPKLRLFVQASWLPFDILSNQDRIKNNEDREKTDLSALRKTTQLWREQLEKQVDKLNREQAKQAVFIVPVGDAVCELRMLVAAGKFPGVTRQADLFSDPLGHGLGHIQALTTYCHFAAIYRRSPEGLRLVEPGVDEAQHAILQKIAWDTVSSYSHSGVVSPKDVAMSPTKQTYVYKKVGELEIQADVYRFADEQSRPVVVWIHGGALINGHREGINEPFRKGVIGAGAILVSIDYRLAPETQLPEILQDVEDAITWVRREGPTLFHADPARVAVSGGSAGGYLTLVTGYRVQPPPTALVAFWGYGDLVGDWYSKPSPHPRHHTIKTTRDGAYQQVAGPPIADSRQRQGDGGIFYQYCRQTGTWPMAVSGVNPHAEPEKFFPFMPVKNVTQNYPPTLLIHGDADTDVPFEQSQLMAAEFRRHGVSHRLIGLPGGEHGLSGVDPNVVRETYDASVMFLKEQLGLSSAK